MANDLGLARIEVIGFRDLYDEHLEHFIRKNKDLVVSQAINGVAVTTEHGTKIAIQGFANGVVRPLHSSAADASNQSAPGSGRAVGEYVRQSNKLRRTLEGGVDRSTDSSADLSSRLDELRSRTWCTIS